MIDIRFDIFEKSSNGDCKDGVRDMEGELVLDEEAVVDAAEAMEIGSDTVKEKWKLGEKLKS